MQATNHPQKYYLNNWQRFPMWFLSGIALLFSLLMLVAGLGSRGLWAPLFLNVSGFAGLIGLPLFLSATFTHIESSPEGIGYYWMFWRARTAWQNVVAVTPHGLVLDAGVRKETWLWAMLITADGNRPLIPLGSFIAHWQTSALGDDIRKYASQLNMEPKEG